jgi:hypothetical protein
MVAVIGGVGFLAVLVSIYWHEYRDDSVLSSQGVKAIAVLDDTYTEYKRHGMTESYSVTYEFNVDGKTYIGEGKIKTLPVGRNIEVLYNPANPETNSPVGILMEGYRRKLVNLAAASAAAFTGLPQRLSTSSRSVTELNCGLRINRDLPSRKLRTP